MSRHRRNKPKSWCGGGGGDVEGSASESYHNGEEPAEEYMRWKKNKRRGLRTEEREVRENGVIKRTRKVLFFINREKESESAREKERVLPTPSNHSTPSPTVERQWKETMKEKWTRWWRNECIATKSLETKVFRKGPLLLEAVLCRGASPCFPNPQSPQHNCVEQLLLISRYQPRGVFSLSLTETPAPRHGTSLHSVWLNRSENGPALRPLYIFLVFWQPALVVYCFSVHSNVN